MNVSISFLCMNFIVLGVIGSTFKNTTSFFQSKSQFRIYFETYSGYQDIDWYFPKDTAAIYYSLWKADYLGWDDHTMPLIIWLQGGPGGSSQFGCFNEIGPFFIKGSTGSYSLQYNSYSWNFHGHLLCIDQPIGVGFSYNKGNKKVDSTPEAAKHFINFMANFYKNNRFDLIKNPLYIAGQSYAGHYIPAFAELIKANGSLGINLAGVLIGDGYVDPLIQNNNFDAFLYSAGIVSKGWRQTTTFMQTEAITRILRQDYVGACNYTNFMIADDQVSEKYYNGMNVLNYKQYDQGNINPNYSGFLEQYKSQFGVSSNVPFIDDNQEMYYAFCDDLQRSFKSNLEYLLNNNVKVLIYNGQNDFIVNTAGVLSYLNILNWSGATNWRRTPKTMWKFIDSNRGWYKSYGNLIFVMVRNAGHLLPSDQPGTASFMLSYYFNNIF